MFTLLATPVHLGIKKNEKRLGVMQSSKPVSKSTATEVNDRNYEARLLEDSITSAGEFTDRELTDSPTSQAA